LWVRLLEVTHPDGIQELLVIFKFGRSVEQFNTLPPAYVIIPWAMFFSFFSFVIWLMLSSLMLGAGCGHSCITGIIRSLQVFVYCHSEAS
jgi:hypothetical protein